MAFGRLDVFLPTGEFKSYPLTDEAISIGRSPGSGITIETDSLSRYHASLTYAQGVAQITDLESINGTFVDGVRLQANDPHTLLGGEEITAGDVRIIFQLFDDSPTRPMIILEDDATRRVARAEVPFRVEIEQPEFAVPPGAYISSTITLTNTADTTRRFRVDISGLPEGWARQDRREIEVASGLSGTLQVNFKPRRRSDSAPGDYSITVSAFAVDEPTLKLSGVVVLRVLPYYAFGMALEKAPQRPTPAGPTPADRRSPMRVHLYNGGSAPLTLRLITRDLEEALSLSVTPALITLAPGARSTAQIQAQPRRRRWFGEMRTYSFDVVARSSDTASYLVPIRATLDDRPPLPSWALFVIGGLGLTLLMLVVVGLLFLIRPATPGPQINRLVVVNGVEGRVLQSEPVMVEWEVENASTIRFLIDELEVYRDTQPQGSAALDSSSLLGEHDLVLLASGEGGNARQSVRIDIVAPLQVGSFSYTPRPLMLYVAQTLTLDWLVPGASITQINGLEGFSFNAPNSATPFGESGSISLSGITLTPISISLEAERDGATLSQRYDLEMATPRCDATAGAVPLRALPDGAAQVVATIPAGANVTVDAQDPFGRWLRVQLAGSAQGWGERTALSCTTFSPDDLYKAINTLPPTPDLPLPSTIAPLTAEPPATLIPATPAG